MMSRQTITRMMNELSSITGTAITVTDASGEIIISAGEPSADTQAEGMEVTEDDRLLYTLTVTGENAGMVARIAASELREMAAVSHERVDRNSFFQSLLMDNLLVVDIYKRAKKLHIEDPARRLVYVVEVGSVSDTSAADYLSSIFTQTNGDYVTSVDESNVIVIKALGDNDTGAEIEKTAALMVGTLNAEAMINARVSYGTPFTELRNLSRSYKEAMLAMEVGRIFYAENTINAYDRLGIGRLIYQLPANLCRMFINEVFSDGKVLELDEEMRVTVDRFFENNLNVSETSRKLFVHRNTLVYRIDRLQKEIGLDIREFDDALTLKIALMVDSYLKHLDYKEAAQGRSGDA